ncbi:hypothetical protein M422DRAFT_32158 [Sphaerobolus stellatus SS14]|uniref:Uncharacterized protein n=1 Tax=Sphaerobolus stellatus (strain SS14) TaxID=990650 RepID=A0A0C9VR02_SPHS4|nr:hypothetical protein M422DRAFT_32158 [Sphaerobolus stellatus SS14]
MQQLPFHVLFQNQGRRTRSSHSNAGKIPSTASWITPSSTMFSRFKYRRRTGKTSDVVPTTRLSTPAGSIREPDTFPFTELPTDVIDIIFQWAINMSTATGASLCLVSQGVFDLAAPILYHTVFLPTDSIAFSFLQTILSEPRGLSYRKFICELYIPTGSGFSPPTGRISLPNIRRLSIPHFSYLNRIEDVSSCQHLTLTNRNAVLEQIPTRAILSSLTHITLPPRWNMRGIILTPSLLPSLTHLALPISVGVGSARHLIIQDQRHFLAVTNSKFNLKKIVLLPWRTFRRELISEMVNRQTLLEDLGIDVGDAKYMVVACSGRWDWD